MRVCGSVKGGVSAQRRRAGRISQHIGGEHEVMKRIDLIRDMKEYTGSGVISKTKLCGYLQKSRNDDGMITGLLTGLDYIPDGRGKKYFIPDVADRILASVVKQ